MSVYRVIHYYVYYKFNENIEAIQGLVLLLLLCINDSVCVVSQRNW